MPGIRGLPEPPLHFCPNPVFFHEPGDPVLPALGPLLSQLLCYPRAAVNSSVLLIDLLDPAQQQLILSPSFTRFSIPPRVITTARNPQDLAHLGKPVRVPVIFQKQVLHQLRLENTLKAFFKISRSSLTSSRSFWRRFSSASSGFSFPVPTKALSPSAK